MKQQNFVRRVILGLAFSVICSPVLGHEFAAGDLKIVHPYIPKPASVQVAGGYMTIENKGAAEDRLLSIESPAAQMVHLHETKTNDQGEAKMQPVDTLAIPANGKADLQQGGYHIMFMGLSQALKVGDHVPAVLVFEKAGRVAVEFSVDEPKADAQPHH